MYPPGTGYFVPTSPNPSMPVQSVMQSLPIRRKDLLHSHGRVNLYAQPSYAPSGADLPGKLYRIIGLYFIRPNLKKNCQTLIHACSG